MRKVTFELQAEGDSAYSIAEALHHAAEKLEEGYTSGDLRNADIDSGTWTLTSKGGPDDEDRSDELRETEL